MNCRFKLWRKTRILDSTQESTSTQQLSLLTVVKPYLDYKMIKPITEVVTITCLWHNDLFSKKKSQGQVCYCCFTLVWITSWKYFICPRKLGNQNIAKTVRASFDWYTQAAFQLHDIFYLKGSVYVFEGILDYKNFERLYSFNVIPSHPREW